MRAQAWMAIGAGCATGASGTSGASVAGCATGASSTSGASVASGGSLASGTKP